MSINFVRDLQEQPSGYELENGKYMTVETEKDAYKIQIYEALTFRQKESHVITDAKNRQDAIDQATFDRKGYGVVKTMNPQEIMEKSK